MKEQFKDLLHQSTKRVADRMVLPYLNDTLSTEEPATPDYSAKFKWRNEPLPARPSIPKIDAVLVRAQNVRDYFLLHEKEHGWNEFRSFSCVKMPYERMVLSYMHKFYDREKREHERHVDLVVTSRTPEYFSHYLKPEVIEDFGDWNPQLVEQHQQELTQVVEAVQPDSFIEVQISADLMTWPGRLFVMVDETGQVLVRDPFGYIYIRDPEETALVAKMREFHGMTGDEVVTEVFAKHSAIALATIQFMNCRNVEVVDNPPSRQQRRAAERAGKEPPVTYKTIVIHPIGKRAQRRGVPGAPTGIEMSLHICRGHFKDYRQGGGLGKYHRHGMWWWSPQVRGKSEVGKVVKDYEVEPEENT